MSPDPGRGRPAGRPRVPGAPARGGLQAGPRPPRGLRVRGLAVALDLCEAYAEGTDAYSRSFVIPESPRVYAYTLETGTEFQPTYQKAIIIMFEVAAGLVQFCLECVCAVTELMQSAELASADAAPLSDRVIIA